MWGVLAQVSACSLGGVDGPATDDPARGGDPIAALRRCVYLLDRELAPQPKVKAFQRAIDIVDELGTDAIAQRVHAGTLQQLDGIGKSTGGVIEAAVRGEPSPYVADLEARSVIELSLEATPYRDALRGDCHLHSTWSDGGAGILAMAETARDLGHEYMALTDHSARLTIAHGLSQERLLEQLDEVEAVNEQVAPFRILTGMEVDILEDGSLDMSDELLGRLDLVVGSVHSKLRLDREAMTRRMVVAIANPHVDILGHCTNRKVVGRGRPPSDFDPEIVFAACAKFDTAIEINCRPERLDPPDELLALAVEWECKVAIDTDAHAPGQLEWQPYGCAKAAACKVPIESIVNTWAADELTAWAAGHDAR